MLPIAPTALPPQTLAAKPDAALQRTVVVRGGGYFPVVVRLRGRHLAAVLRGGATHLGLGGRLDWVESRDGGQSWSPPRAVVDGPLDDRNPALGRMADGSLVLAWAECSCYDAAGNWSPAMGGFALFSARSTNGGRTWSARKPLDAGPIGREGSPYGRIITLPSGVALMTVYGAPKPDAPSSIPQAHDVSGILFSRDNGRTWTDFTVIAAGGFNETAIVGLGGRRVLAAMRSEGGQVYIARSQDAGRTWSPPERVTGGPEGRWQQHPADLVALPGGEVLMVTGNRLPPFGVCAALSLDSGVTWGWESRTSLAADSLHTDCGYPSAVRLPSGEVVCVYYTVGDATGPETRAYCVRIPPASLAAMRRAQP